MAAGYARGGVSAVAFGATASGQLLLATASKNRKVRLWDPDQQVEYRNAPAQV